MSRSRRRPDERDYPFIPKTTTSLVAGDFWGLRIAGARWGCMRLLALEPGSRTRLYAGLVDWCGADRPTPASVSGRPLLECWELHVKTIAECGDGIEGTVPLDEDGTKLPLEISARQLGVPVYRGFEVERCSTPDDVLELPQRGVGGYKYPLRRAQRLFDGR